MPNTEVKLISAENTWLETTREDKAMPVLFKRESAKSFPIYSSIAQSVEHAAVNRRVVGSSPTWGAYREEPPRGVDVAALFLKGLWAFSSVG